jgi:hypothetical protein
MVVALFLICQLPNLILHTFHAVNMRLGNLISQSYVTQWANFLLIVNSSFNFVIYSVLSQNFREEAKKMFTFTSIIKMYKQITANRLESNNMYEPVALETFDKDIKSQRTGKTEINNK